MAERRADEAVRDVTDWLKCEFKQSRVGEVFTGRISSVVGFGLFIELHDYFVEGLVHISALPGDYYRFEPEKQRLWGEKGGRSYNLGDDVEIIVSRVNLEDRQIDFDLTEAIDNPDKPFKKATRKKAAVKAGSDTPAGFKAKPASKAVKKDKTKVKKKKKSASRPGKKERAKNKAK